MLPETEWVLRFESYITNHLNYRVRAGIGYDKTDIRNYFLFLDCHKALETVLQKNLIKKLSHRKKKIEPQGSIRGRLLCLKISKMDARYRYFLKILSVTNRVLHCCLKGIAISGLCKQLVQRTGIIPEYAWERG